MKKELVLFVMMLLPLVASAELKEIDGIFYNLEHDTKTAEVTNGKVYSGEIEIPESFTYENETYIVNSIGDFAFYECTSLTSIILPERLQSVGNSAFSGCSSISNLTIPSNVTIIGNRCFSACSQLNGIILPSKLVSVGDYCFNGCVALSDITIPNGVNLLGDYCFYDCI